MSTYCAEDYLLWRLQVSSKYSAIAYVSSDYVAGGATPQYTIMDKASYGPDGVENQSGVYWVYGPLDAENRLAPLGDVDTLMEGIRLAEIELAHRRVEKGSHEPPRNCKKRGGPGRTRTCNQRIYETAQNPSYIQVLCLSIPQAAPQHTRHCPEPGPTSIVKDVRGQSSTSPRVSVTSQ